MHLHLSVRFTGEQENEPAHTVLTLPVAETAFLLVDGYDDDPQSSVGRVLTDIIAPTLAAVRRMGMSVVDLHGGDHGDPNARDTELHGTRRQRTRQVKPWQPAPLPSWLPGTAPTTDDAVIEKFGQNGFRGTALDRYLRVNGIVNLLCAGFSFKSCLFYTIVGAFERNYRVVFLRDGTHPPGENEFADTRDDRLPEKGWVRLVLTRLIEDHLGYSATCVDLIDACSSAPRPALHRDHQLCTIP